MFQFEELKSLANFQPNQNDHSSHYFTFNWPASCIDHRCITFLL